MNRILNEHERKCTCWGGGTWNEIRRNKCIYIYIYLFTFILFIFIAQCTNLILSLHSFVWSLVRCRLLPFAFVCFGVFLPFVICHVFFFVFFSLLHGTSLFFLLYLLPFSRKIIATIKSSLRMWVNAWESTGENRRSGAVPRNK